MLDAGSGPGRFSIEMARLGAQVTVLDISSGQLGLARQKIDEAGQTACVERYVKADIADLSSFPDASFDTVVCFGGALSYVCDRRHQAAAELVRITRRGGGVVNWTRGPMLYLLKEPDKAHGGEPALLPVVETGDLPGFPSRRTGLQHAAMHLYMAEELQNLFAACEAMEVAGSNVTVFESSPTAQQIAEDPQAWATLIELKRKMNADPGLVNSGTHIILAMRR